MLHLHPGIVEGHELLRAALARDSEASRHIVELPDQLYDQVDYLGIGPIARLGRISRSLAGRLLQRRNGGGRRHALRRGAGRRLGVSGGLAQLVDAGVVVVDIVSGQRLVVDDLQRVLAEVAVHRHQRLRQIQQLFLVHARVLPLEIARHGSDHRVLDERRVHQVDRRLRIPAEIHEAVSIRRALDREELVEHKGIQPVVIQRRALVLCRVQAVGVNVLDVVQNRLAVPFLVIAIDHDALAVRRYVVVVLEPGRLESLPLQLVLELRVLRFQQVVVHQIRVEEILAVLNVGNARLPEQIQQIHREDGDIPQAVQLGRIPHHLVNARAGLQLRPQRIGIGILKAVLLHDHRHDGGQHLRLFLVVRFSRQDVRLWICLYAVRVLRHDDVVQPARLGAEAAVKKAGILLLLRVVAQLPPVLRGYHAALQPCLAGFVLQQGLCQLLQLFLVDDHGLFVHRQCLFVHLCPPFGKLIERIVYDRLLLHRAQRLNRARHT